MSQLHEFSRLEERRVVGAVENLVEAGVVEASGSGISRSYILSSKVYKADDALPAYVRQNNISATRQRGLVLELAEKNGGEVTSSEVMNLLGLSYISAYRLLKKMEDGGANWSMRARAAPRDISSRKQNMPASGDGTANEYPRNHLQGNVRSTSRVPSRIRARTESAQEFGRYL